LLGLSAGIAPAEGFVLPSATGAPHAGRLIFSERRVNGRVYGTSEPGARRAGARRGREWCNTKTSVGLFTLREPALWCWFQHRPCWRPSWAALTYLATFNWVRGKSQSTSSPRRRPDRWSSSKRRSTIQPSFDVGILFRTAPGRLERAVVQARQLPTSERPNISRRTWPLEPPCGQPIIVLSGCARSQGRL